MITGPAGRLTSRRSLSGDSVPPYWLAPTRHSAAWSVLFDLGEQYQPTARGTAGKRFVVRVFALTDGNELAVADSKPVTLFTARKLEVRARRSDALDVEVYPADELPPLPDGFKVITLLRGFQIVSVDKDLYDLMLSTPAPLSDNESA